MRFAVPCEEKRVAQQFGNASQFAFFDANPRSGHILQQQVVDSPGQGPDVVSRWVADYGTDVVLAAGLSTATRRSLSDRGVAFVVGARSNDPRELVQSFLADSLTSDLEAPTVGGRT